MSKMFDYIVNGGDKLAETEAALEHALGHLGIELEENAKLRSDNARLRSQCDTYGLALMMIREGAANPQGFARETLDKFAGRGAVDVANTNMLDGPDRARSRKQHA